MPRLNRQPSVPGKAVATAFRGGGSHATGRRRPAHIVAPGLAAVPPGRAAANGTQTELWSCNGGGAQEWT